MLLRKVNLNHLYLILFTSHHSFSNLQFLFSCLESQSIFEDVTEYFRESVRWEQLQFLLTEDEPWKNFVIEADLSR